MTGVLETSASCSPVPSSHCPDLLLPSPVHARPVTVHLPPTSWCRNDSWPLKQELGVRAPTSHSAPHLDSSTHESDIGQDAQTHDQGPQLGVSDEDSPPDIDFEECLRYYQTQSGLFRTKHFIISPGHHDFPPFQTGQPLSPPQGKKHTAQSLGPGDASVLRERSPIKEAPGPRDGFSEDKEKLPSLAFLLASQYSQWPWEMSQSSSPGPLKFALEVQGLPRPPPLRQLASAQLLHQLPSLGCGLQWRPSVF